MIKRIRALYALVPVLFFFAGCEKEKIELPAAPAGSLTIGTEGHEMGSAVVAIPSGGFIAAMSKQLNSGEWDSELLELDDDGGLLQRHEYPLDGESEVIRCIRGRAAGGYLVGSIFQLRSENKARFRLRVLDESLAVEDSHEFGEIAGPYAGSYTTGSSHMEVFELPIGGWLVIGQHGYSQIAYQIGPSGNVLSSRATSGEGSYANIPLHNFAQDSAGTVYRLGVVNNYPNLTILIDELDASGYAASTVNIQLDSAFQQSDYFEMYPAGLDIISGNRFVGTIQGRIYSSQHLFEFDPITGAISWHRVLSLDESLQLLDHDTAGNIFFAGYSPSGSFYGSGQQSDGTIGTVDSQGNSLSRRSVGGPYSDNLMDMALGADGRVLAIGSTASYGAGGFDAFFVFYP